MPEANPATPAPVPAPYGGINLRDGVAALQPFEARDMVNWEPNGASVVPRKGQQVHATAASPVTGVKTLAVWSNAIASKLIGVAGRAYDFSADPAVLIAASPTYVDSRFITECYQGFLIGVNGSEAPWTYNGTTWAAATWTGVSLPTLAYVRMVHNRLWFAAAGSANAWYGTVGGVTAGMALTQFQLSQVITDGYLVAIGAHSQEAGQGADDLTVFVTSTGKVAVYSGDPAQTFTKIGIYNLGAIPVGRDCLFQLGGALHILTTLGVIPLNVAMQTSSMDFTALGNYGKVGPGLKRYADLYRQNPGWFLRTWNGRLIVNTVTLFDVKAVQWVLNSLVGAWTRWEQFDAASMCEWLGDLYWGDFDANVVHKVGGTSDEGLPIPVSVRSACVAFFQGQQSQITAIRFDMAVSGSFTARFGIDDDYMTRPIAGHDQIIATSAQRTPWGTVPPTPGRGKWGSPWGSSEVAKPQWMGCYGTGRALGIAMEGFTQATSVEWFGNQVLVQQLGPGV